MHEHVFVPRAARFTEADLRRAIARSASWAETLRDLGYRSAGGNWRTLKKYARLWGISTDHFDPDAARNEALKAPKRRLDEIMIAGSTYSRFHLKRRLFEEGRKDRVCEECGQGESWRGRRMALILDHINGVPDDHRFENLRILCPNCAATLETHCGSKNRTPKKARKCPTCGESFLPARHSNRYCSRACGQRWNRTRQPTGEQRPRTRRVERPPYPELIAEIEEYGYVATGRRYGVSDNAIRKWVKFYERELERRDSGELA